VLRYQQPGLNGEVLVYTGRPSTSPVAPILWAETTVAVRNANLGEIDLALRPGARIQGRIVFEGNADKPTAEALAATALGATAVDGRSFAALPASAIRPDGSFETAGVPPGGYRLEVVPYVRNGLTNWSLASLEIDGRPGTGRPIVVGAADVQVVLRYTDRQTQLTGTVRDEDGRPAPDAAVYVFSTDRETWVNQYGSAAVKARLTRSGVYETALVPGEYFVAAVAIPNDNWQRLEALDALSKTATRVMLPLGRTANVDVVVRLGQ
jgi:hypothetical protein